jgi:hypothetical protein
LVDPIDAIEHPAVGEMCFMGLIPIVEDIGNREELDAWELLGVSC